VADFMACGVSTPNPLGAASSKHYGQRRMRLVWSKSIGGSNYYDYSNHDANGVSFNAWLA
jgi:hypothetical protein